MPPENEQLYAMSANDSPAPKSVTFSPDREPQRGRKRQRTPLPFAVVTGTTKTLSGESATFRGRSRHRAASLAPLSGLSSAFSSRNTSRNRGDRSSASPRPSSRKRQHLRLPPTLVMTEYQPQYQQQQYRRRSQSPSRSRSATAVVERHRSGELWRRRRRRRRTHSRSLSRDEGLFRDVTSFPSFPAAGAGVDGVTSLASPLRVVELLGGGSEGSRDAGE